MTEMAMFPLGTVLLPGEALPLHIFEPRYRQMITDLLSRDDQTPEFAVVLIERGSEIGGGDQRSDIGTAALVTHIEVTEDGRYGVLAVGDRRIRVETWLADDPYPRALVSDLADTGPSFEGDPFLDQSEARGTLELAVAATHLRVTQAHLLAVELGDFPAGQDLRITEDPVMATFQLATLSPLGPRDRQLILAATGPMERLDLLDRCLDDVEAMLKFRAS
jgi:Lon protease-like protein